MTPDAPQAETSPNRRLFLENCTTGGTSSEKEEPTLGRTPELASRAEKAEADPRLWRKLRTGAMTRVKTCGAAERPRQRAENW